VGVFVVLLGLALLIQQLRPGISLTSLVLLALGIGFGAACVSVVRAGRVGPHAGSLHPVGTAPWSRQMDFGSRIPMERCHAHASLRPSEKVHPHVHADQARPRQTCVSALPESLAYREDPVRYQGSGGSRLPLILFIAIAIAVVVVAYFLFFAPK
jgi:hypothetical protein